MHSFRYKRGYKNVIGKGVELNKQVVMGSSEVATVRHR
jgi:hypothetical protein